MRETWYKFVEVVESHGGQYAYLATDIQKTIDSNLNNYYGYKQQAADKEKLTQAFQVVEDADGVTNSKQTINHNREMEVIYNYIILISPVVHAHHDIF